MEKTLVKSLTMMEEDGEWLKSKHSEMTKKYHNKFLAVQNKEIIAKGEDIKEVIKEVKERGVNPALILIEYITNEKFDLIPLKFLF